MSDHNVFVYGSLKGGHWNNHHLRNARFLGEAVTCAKYRMLDSGFPVLVEDGDGHPVKGELYLVPNDVIEQRLDRLESVGRMYDRKRCEVTLNNGGPVDTFIYIGCDGPWDRHRENPGWLNEHGELEWKFAEHDEDDEPEEPEEDEVVEPEDQDQGDVLGLHDDEMLTRKIGGGP